MVYINYNCKLQIPEETFKKGTIIHNFRNYNNEIYKIIN